MNSYPVPGQKLEDHPISQLFPMMDPAEKADLGESIRKNGLREKIILLDGMILDGRNRYEECLRVGVEPVFEFYDPRIHGKSPLEFVTDLNLRRRQLTASQKAAIAAELLPMFQEEAKSRQRASGKQNQGNLKNRPAAAVAAEDESQVPACPTCGLPPDVGCNCAMLIEVTGAHGASVPPAVVKVVSDEPKWKLEREAFELDQTIQERTTGGDVAGEWRDCPQSFTPDWEDPHLEFRVRPMSSVETVADKVGVSKTLVKRAKALPAEKREEVKAGKKSVDQAERETKEQKEAVARQEAIQRIQTVCGTSLAQAVTDGTRLKTTKEILAYAALPDDKMIQTRGLIQDGWKVSDAVKYEARDISVTNKVGDLLKRAAHSGGIFTLLIEQGGSKWEVQVTRKSEEVK